MMWFQWAGIGFVIGSTFAFAMSYRLTKSLIKFAEAQKVALFALADHAPEDVKKAVFRDLIKEMPR